MSRKGTQKEENNKLKRFLAALKAFSCYVLLFFATYVTILQDRHSQTGHDAQKAPNRVPRTPTIASKDDPASSPDCPGGIVRKF